MALDTCSLEKACFRKFKISPKETMRIAEKLYTRGFISYPRTETNKFNPSINLSQIIRNLKGNAFGNIPYMVDRILQNGPDPRNGYKSDGAHPPIYALKPGYGLNVISIIFIDKYF